MSWEPPPPPGSAEIACGVLSRGSAALAAIWWLADPMFQRPGLVVECLGVAVAFWLVGGAISASRLRPQRPRRLRDLNLDPTDQLEARIRILLDRGGRGVRR